ncbi:Prophage Clp protease-like protein [Desulfosporosinus sp. I2]|uniref:head maturation protease, ClpP-related n=1 Tax=Desulfosporosinus sp. I2 TaxID=1617025 RepID=UPI00061E48EC|nr:head maturation protease, ClpP-related [Desulfosporosinus sp. I2]KJR48411.1 Prophage Clp protease-like protein [Desulfosporosinus sp. I2]
MKKFWEFKAKAGSPNVGELLLYGDISSSTWWGDEVTPMTFAQELKGLGDISVLNIYINSGGGDVFAGLAIYSMLKRHPAQKNVYIDGLAASIASVIAMAGDTVYMPRNAMMMIHKAWTMAIGNANDLRKLADDMDKIDQSILTTYQEKTGMEPQKISEMVNAETWLTAEEAVALGFADVLEETKQIAASMNKDYLTMNGLSFDLSRFRNPPNQAMVGSALDISVNDPPNNQPHEKPNNQAVVSVVAEPLPNYLPEVHNAGRTISSTNEALIRQAVDSLTEVLAQLDNDETDDEADGKGADDEFSLLEFDLYQAQFNLNRRRLDHGF